LKRLARVKGKARSLGASLRQVPVLLTNIRLDWKGSQGTSALAYHKKFVNHDCKKVLQHIHLGPVSQKIIDLYYTENCQIM
jgi:hypothetical protein